MEAHKLPLAVRYSKQLVSLLYKNYLIMIRQWQLLLVSLLIPGAFVLLLNATFTRSNPPVVRTDMTLNRCRTFAADQSFNVDDNCITLIYAPQNAEFDAIMKRVASENGLNFGSDIVGFASDQDMATKIATQVGYVEAAISFYTPTDYAIWYNASTWKTYLYNNLYAMDTQTTYLATVQAAINSAVLARYSPQDEPNVRHLKLAITPFPSLRVGGTLDPDDSTGIIFAPTLLATGGVVTGLVAMFFVVGEKRAKLLGAMRMMGLVEATYWNSWLISLAIVMVVPAIFVPLLGRALGMFFFLKCDFSVLFVLHYTFFAAMCSFTIFVASIATQPRWVNVSIFLLICWALLQVFIFTAVYGPGGMYGSFQGAPTVTQIISYGLPWMNYAKCMDDIIRVVTPPRSADSDAQSYTYKWEYLGNPIFAPENPGLNLPGPTTGFNIWVLVIMLVGYNVLAWYCGQCFSSSQGKSKSPLFIFMPQFWGCKAGRQTVMAEDTIEQKRMQSEREECVVMHKISKSFATTTAVKELSIKMNKGELTAVLGHNGAGKTTALSMLTGLYAPTHGHCFVFGHSVAEDVDAVQRSMGICPQENLLWEQLSAREHMTLYATFRDIPHDEQRAAIDAQLHAFRMLDVKGPAGAFSGGMKRRLLIAMACVGKPKVVVLDEPTTGMDPLNRRHTWTAIEQLKRECVVVLTTHSMEEADALGDQIAIMSGGVLRANGTSLFLKNRFGAGYQITLLADPDNIPSLKQIVLSLLPGSELLDSAAGNLTLGVPVKNKRFIAKFFKWIEKGEDSRVVKEWALSDSTLEEVFLRLSQMSKGVNEVGVDFSENVAKLCAICNKEPAGDVTLYTSYGFAVHCSGVVCLKCAAAPQVPEADGSILSPTSAHLESIDDDDTTHSNKSEVVNSSDTEQQQHALSTQQPQFSIQQDLAPVPLHTDQPPYQPPYAGAHPQQVPYSGAHPQQHPGTQPPYPGAQPPYPGAQPPYYPGTQPPYPGATQPPYPGAPSGGAYAPLDAPIDQNNNAPVKPIPLFAQIRAVYLNDMNLLKKQRRSNCCLITILIFSIISIAAQNALIGSAGPDPNTNSLCPQGYYADQDWYCDPELFAEAILQIPVETARESRYDYPLPAVDTPTWILKKYYAYGTGSYTTQTVWFTRDAGVSLNNWNPLGRGPNIINSTWAVFLEKETDIPDLVVAGQQEWLSHFDEPRLCSGYSWTKGMYINATNYEAVARMWKTFPDVGLALHELDTNRLVLDADIHLYNVKRYPTYPAISMLYGPPGEYCNSIYLYDQPYYSDSPIKGDTAFTFVNNLAEGILRSSTKAPVSTEEIDGESSAGLPKFNVTAVQLPKLKYPFLDFLDPATQGTILISCLVTSLWLPTFTSNFVLEREENLLHMMRISGLRLVAYWTGKYLYCMTVTMVWAMFYIAIGYLMDISLIKHSSPILFFAVLLNWAHAQVGVSVFISSLLTKARVASMLMYLFVLCLVFVNLIINATVGQKQVPTVVLLIPPLAYARGLSRLLKDGGNSIPLGSELSKCMISLFFISWVLFFLGVYLSYLRHHPIITKLKTWLIRVTAPCWSRTPEARQLLHRGEKQPLAALSLNTPLVGASEEDVDSSKNEDQDVFAERQRVLGMTPEDVGRAAVHISHLRKVYLGARTKLAVRDLCLGIDYGECFGLLGPNGAGKTTTLSILSGLLAKSDGSALIAGLDTTDDVGLIYRILGVCPQFDTVWPELTVAEHLYLYCRIKGHPRNEERGRVQHIAEAVGLDGDAFNMQSSQLSGGMRRRLSIGISLIGDPKVWLLDEPTTGLDPETRRLMWGIVNQQKTKGRCIIITTHSMEEADTLCSRIGIMSDGALQCLGSQIHLKNRFGDGYKLTVNLDPARLRGPAGGASSSSGGVEQVADVSELVTQLAPHARLNTSFGHARTYIIPKAGIEVSKLFTELEAKKEQYGIREWGLTQTSLEEVFLKIVRQAEEAGAAAPEP